MSQIYYKIKYMEPIPVAGDNIFYTLVIYYSSVKEHLFVKNGVDKKTIRFNAKLDKQLAANIQEHRKKQLQWDSLFFCYMFGNFKSLVHSGNSLPELIQVQLNPPVDVDDEIINYQIPDFENIHELEFA